MIGTDTRTFPLPDLGEGLTEAEIVTWRVATGDEVGIDDIVVDVETAKAVVEVPCPYAGRVVELHAAAGDTVAVGAPLLTISPPSDVAARGAEIHRTEERAGSGAVLVGYGTSHAPSRRRRRGGGASSGPPPAPAPPSSTASTTRPSGAPRVISPVVRRLAAERGVDLAGLTGSGPAGVVLRRDVEAASPASSAPGSAQPPAAAEAATGDRVVLRGVRRTIADKLARSRREIPDATTWVDVDATGLVEARAAVRTAAGDRSIGLLALLARIVVAGLTRFPELNVSVEAAGDDLVVVRHPGVNLGFAAQTDRGLVVPVVRSADRLTTAELDTEIRRLTDLARDGRLGTEELTGGTFTLNNYGVFGVDGSTPIINHPEAALLGVGRIVDKPWVVDGTLAVRKVTQLSLTFDHRVCDGGTAGGFLRYVADAVERPLGLLADL